MPQIQFLKGKSANLRKVPLSDGTIYFTEDTRRLYIDTATQRLPVAGDQVCGKIFWVQLLPDWDETTLEQTVSKYYENKNDSQSYQISDILSDDSIIFIGKANYGTPDEDAIYPAIISTDSTNATITFKLIFAKIEGVLQEPNYQIPEEPIWVQIYCPNPRASAFEPITAFKTVYTARLFLDAEAWEHLEDDRYYQDIVIENLDFSKMPYLITLSDDSLENRPEYLNLEIDDSTAILKIYSPADIDFNINVDLCLFMAEGNNPTGSVADTLIYEEHFNNEESTDSFWTNMTNFTYPGGSAATHAYFEDGYIYYVVDDTSGAGQGWDITFPTTYNQEILKIQFDFSTYIGNGSTASGYSGNVIGFCDSNSNKFITFTFPQSNSEDTQVSLIINQESDNPITFDNVIFYRDNEAILEQYKAELTIDFFNKTFNCTISNSSTGEILNSENNIPFMADSSNLQHLFLQIGRSIPNDGIVHVLNFYNFYIYESVRPTGEWAILEVGQGPLNGENYIDVESAYLAAVPESQERHYIVFCADSKNLGYADVENIEYLGNGVYRVYFKEGVTQIRENFDCHIIQLNNIADIHEGELRSGRAWSEISTSSSLDSPSSTVKNKTYYYQYWPQATSSIRLAGKHIPIIYPKNISDSGLFDHLIETKIYNNRLQFIADERLSATLPIVIIDFK